MNLKRFLISRHSQEYLAQPASLEKPLYDYLQMTWVPIWYYAPQLDSIFIFVGPEKLAKRFTTQSGRRSSAAEVNSFPCFDIVCYFTPASSGMSEHLSCKYYSSNCFLQIDGVIFLWFNHGQASCDKFTVYLTICSTWVLAVWSWPFSSKLANSLFDCLTCASLLFLNSFILETASFNAVLHLACLKLLCNMLCIKRIFYSKLLPWSYHVNHCNEAIVLGLQNQP